MTIPLATLDDAARAVKPDRDRPAVRVKERQPLFEAAAAPTLSWLDPSKAPRSDRRGSSDGEAAKVITAPRSSIVACQSTSDLYARRATTRFEEFMPFLEATPRQFLARRDAVNATPSARPSSPSITSERARNKSRRPPRCRRSPSRRGYSYAASAKSEEPQREKGLSVVGYLICFLRAHNPLLGDQPRSRPLGRDPDPNLTLQEGLGVSLGVKQRN